VAATLGTLSTALAGANNDLDFSARFPGPGSSSIQIAYVDPGVATGATTCAVSFSETTGVTTITFTLKYSSGITAIASEIATALAACPEAQKLVTVANKAANDGTGTLIALTATALSVGIGDTSTGYTDADQCEDDGWALGNFTAANGDVVYWAEILVDARVIKVASGTANGRLKAAWQLKRDFVAKASPLRLNGNGTVD
jgi:hypothetical protein